MKSQRQIRLDLINNTEWRNQGEQFYVLATILHDIATVLEYRAGCYIELDEEEE